MPNKPSTTEPAWLNTLTGTRIRIKTPGEETEGRVTVIEYIEPPHSSPPVFTRHEFIEVFCVLHGRLTFQFLDAERFEIQAGKNVTCPSWKPHAFWNETDEPVTALLVCTPAGLDQFFIKSQKLLDDVANGLSNGENMEAAMKALRDQCGLEHVGSPPLPSSPQWS